jgi:hypothetical protein
MLPCSLASKANIPQERHCEKANPDAFAAQHHKDPPSSAHCHLGLGKLYATIGRRAEARAELSAALELYQAMEMTFWLSQAEATLAQVG